MALPLYFVQSMMVSRMATICTVYFVRIHPIICNLVDCTEHQQYNICTDLKTTQVINNQYNLPLSAFIGPAGMPGRCFIKHQDLFFKYPT